MITATLQLSLKNVEVAYAALDRPSPAVRAELESIYSAFTAKRFDKASEGGAGWRPLKPATVKRKGSSAILIDSGEMRKGLSIELTFTPKMKARFNKKKTHSRAKMPIESLLTIHHLGLGRVPQRRILVQPDKVTANRMARVRLRAVKKALNS